MTKAKRIVRWTIRETSVGLMLVAGTEKGVCRLSFGETASDLARHYPDAELVAGGEELLSLAERVVAVVENRGFTDNIPLDLVGTDFQQAVWRALQAIPSGETRTYAQIAAAAGRPGAVRAAGSANGANPVAVLVPCHRVIRSDGSLGGYAWGEGIKRALLEREGAFASA